MWIRSALSHLPKIREQVRENNAKQPRASNSRRLLRNRAAARSRRLLLAARPDHIVDHLQKIVCSEQLEQERIKPSRGARAWSSGLLIPLIATTGTSPPLERPKVRIACNNSNPSFPGIEISERTRSG